MVAAGAPRMNIRGLEHGSDPGGRPVELGKGAAEDERLTLGGPCQAEQQAQGRGLAGAVRAEEAGDAPRRDLKGQVADSGEIAEALGQPKCCCDCHAQSLPRSRDARIGRSPPLSCGLPAGLEEHVCGAAVDERRGHVVALDAAQ